MAKIFFDAATSGNPGRSTCGIVIKENDIIGMRRTLANIIGTFKGRVE